MTIEPAAAEANRSATEVPWDRVERFVGQVTHDIRNGLNAIELQLTFLGEICTEPEAAKEVKLIRRTLVDVTRQLQSLRSVTSLPLLQKLDYPAKDFFEDLQERFERQAPPAKTRVQWHISAGSASLRVDPEVTMWVFLELLTNALRFAAEGTPIDFRVAETGDALVATLHESPAAEPLFAPEQWGRSPLLSTRRGSHGLGLFRVRRILEAQGGDYHVEYSARDQTLITRVGLPLAPAT